RRAGRHAAPPSVQPATSGITHSSPPATPGQSVELAEREAHEGGDLVLAQPIAQRVLVIPGVEDEAAPPSEGADRPRGHGVDVAPYDARVVVQWAHGPSMDDPCAAGHGAGRRPCRVARDRSESHEPSA